MYYVKEGLQIVGVFVLLAVVGFSLILFLGWTKHLTYCEWGTAKTTIEYVQKQESCK